MKGTPTAGIGAALGIEPLHIWLQSRAALTRARITDALGEQELDDNRKCLETMTITEGFMMTLEMSWLTH
jgi:hypothetical protein